ncbi:hypothetical protein [Clostridium oryzae]|uniref:Uncharacterized protein n=1 Tax=Clostridium oryzae TaxID=1450648 RepID=A0A1V4J0N8_9CLOT|nr:hypothetical protein [Clostridium oryzae]OPJ65207.1 hypothetical protein CLORY_02070 [Clostridium oryzae]
MSIEFGMPTLIELAGLEENAKLCNDTVKQSLIIAKSWKFHF